MTSYKDALVLLNDLEEYADTHEFPEALRLISEARKALDKDFGADFPPMRKPEEESGVRLVQ